MERSDELRSPIALQSLQSVLRRQGEPVDALRVLAEHPEWWANKSVVLDLAYEEFCQRDEAGEPVDADQFCARFRACQTSLRRLLEAHQLFEEQSALLGHFEPVAWPKPGDEFLGFRLERELGRGAFARVYQAIEPALGNRAVAVKISLQGGAEAHTLGKLDHPYIVPVFSVQKEALTGLTLVCMPYLGSATLCDVFDAVFAGAAIPTRARALLDAVQDGSEESHPEPLLRSGTYVDGALRIALGMAEALSFMHARGICHRDLKPSNVLVRPNGLPMLLDFNLASDAQQPEQHIGGTLPYMAPEQLRATDRERNPNAVPVDARSDLFSFGVILYELLTGAHPFGPIPLTLTSPELRQLLLERQQGRVCPIRRRNRWVDRPVARLIERCLAYRPEDRPASADELVVFLRRSLSPGRRLRRWLALHRWPVLAGTVILAAVLAVASVLSVPHGTPSERAYAKGLRHYRQGHWPEAVEHFETALAAEPRFVPALRARAQAYQRQQKYDLAILDYTKLDDAQRDGTILACLGFCMSQRRLYPEAITYYQEAIAKGHDRAATYNNLGYTQLRVNRLDDAQVSLDRSIQLDDRLQVAYHNRARIEQQRMPQVPGLVPVKGIEDLRKAMELGAPTADMCFDAAYLCAFAARSDPQWVKPALDYLKQAIHLGRDPQGIGRDVMFAELAKDARFKEVVKAEPIQAKKTSDPLVDPLDE